jgi:hypothetical protein
MRTIAVTLFCAVSSTVFAQQEARYSSYRPEGSPADREKPVQVLSSIGLTRCEALYNIGSFTLNQFEDDAMRKETSLGRQALDEYDLKWITSAENRKAACMQLLRETGKLRWRDRLLLWWQGD